MTEANGANTNEEDLLDGETDDEIDKLLNGEGEKKEEAKTDPEKKEEPKEFYKKVGSREFKSETDYDKFVTTLYGQNSNLAGKVKALGGDPNEVIKPSAKKDDTTQKETVVEKKESNVEEIYYQVEALKFTKQFPEAKEYTEEMQVLKIGRAHV